MDDRAIRPLDCLAIHQEVWDTIIPWENHYDWSGNESNPVYVNA